MAVAGRDQSPPAVRHQTGQAQTTTNFQNALAGDGAVHHALGQAHARGPQQAKQGPCGRRNAQIQRFVQRVMELVLVEQGADDQVFHAHDRNAFLFGQVAG